LVLFLESSFLIFGVIDNVEYVREAAFIGLSAEDEADHDDGERNCRFEVLPVGELYEFALDLKEEVLFLVAHVLYWIILPKGCS
jgi:hypothetical protein